MSSISLEEEDIVFSDEKNKFEDNEICVRKQNRKRRKWLTTVENIPSTYNITQLLNALKKELNCNGTIVTNPVNGDKIIQIQGGYKEKIVLYLQEEFPTYKIKFYGE
ncbi:translation initiation factor 1 [Nematocida sp. AWRm80]|nr:translation initiation factor 1 [Nematocida sp. AWRm80]